MYFERTLAKYIKNVSETFPVVLITGPRQVGKTTIFEKSMLSGREYISLDDLSARDMAQKDPALFLQIHKPPLLIDEVQYAPELFSYIKMIVDKERKNGMFWLTGSQQFQLMKNVSESLAGRVAILDLQGLSQSEKLQNANKPAFWPEETPNNENSSLEAKEIFEFILKGSFPAIFAQENVNLNFFYDSYVRSYIERDVRDLVKVTDEHAFLIFMRVLAARTGQLINYTDIARDVDVSVNTIKSWLSVLETSGLVYLLQPYHANLTSRVVKTPKLYFLDTGLCCYLNNIRAVDDVINSPINGALLETYVVSEIIKSHMHNGLRPLIYFYRDNNQKEIDLIFEKNLTLYPVEIKKTASPSERDVKNFAVLKTGSKKVGNGAIICLAKNFTMLNREITVIPVGCI